MRRGVAPQTPTKTTCELYPAEANSWLNQEAQPVAEGKPKPKAPQINGLTILNYAPTMAADDAMPQKGPAPVVRDCNVPNHVQLIATATNKGKALSMVFDGAKIPGARSRGNTRSFAMRSGLDL